MSILRRPRRPIAWLAILALWLTTVAPVVSQALAASPLDALVGIGWCGPHHDGGTQSPPAGHLLEKCGYCGLLSGHSLLPTTDSAHPVPRLAVVRDAHLPEQPHQSALRSPAASPRGPPAVA